MKSLFGVGLEILAVIKWVECCHISGPPYAIPQWQMELTPPVREPNATRGIR